MSIKSTVFMEHRNRKNYKPEFNAKVAMEAVAGVFENGRSRTEGVGEGWRAHCKSRSGG